LWVRYEKESAGNVTRRRRREINKTTDGKIKKRGASLRDLEKSLLSLKKKLSLRKKQQESGKLRVGLWTIWSLSYPSGEGLGNTPKIVRRTSEVCARQRTFCSLRLGLFVGDWEKGIVGGRRKWLIRGHFMSGFLQRFGNLRRPRGEGGKIGGR